MAGDAGLAFSQNLVENFIRFKLFQIEQDRLERRDQRYSDQLQANRLFNQQTREIRQKQFGEQQDLRERSFAFRKQQAEAPTDISFEGLDAIDEFTESYISSDRGLRTSISPGAISVSRENIIASWNRFRDIFKSTAEGISASDETIGLLRNSFLENIRRRHEGSFRFGAGGGEFDIPDIEELRLSGQQGIFPSDQNLQGMLTPELRRQSPIFPSNQGEEDFSQLSIEELREIAGGQ